MKKKVLFLLSVSIPVFLSGCIFINNNFEMHTAYFNNESSRNIYIQHYSLYDSSGNFSAYGISVPPHTIAVYAAPMHGDTLEKILIVDTDTRKLLKKITGATYFSMLTSPEIVVEKNTSGGKTTCYNYYFIITDEFLSDS